MITSKTPASILYDENRNPVGVVLDGVVYRLQVEAKLAAGSAVIGSVNQGTSPWVVAASSLPLPTGAATESTLSSVLSKLNSSVSVTQGTSPWVVSGPLTDAQLRATAVPVSGTVAVTSSSLALDTTLTGGTQQSKITDGTNIATVKAASTAATATDKAVVVAVSPNTPVGIVQNIVTGTASSYIAGVDGPPLAAGETYTGLKVSTLPGNAIQVMVYSDVASEQRGLRVEQSITGNDGEWFWWDDFTVQGGSPAFGETITAVGNWARVVYTNGGSDQLKFQLNTLICPMADPLPRSPSENGRLRTIRESKRNYLFLDGKITQNGFAVIDDYLERSFTLFINIKDPIAVGTTIQFFIAGVDPGDKQTGGGNTWSSKVFDATTWAQQPYQIASFPATFTTDFKISWVITGTSPAVTGVYLTAMEKPSTVRAVTRNAPNIPHVAQSATAVKLLDTDFSRGTGSIYNNSTATLYIKFGGAPTIAGTPDWHDVIFPGDKFYIEQYEMRSIYGIWDSAGSGWAMINVGY